MSAAVTRHAGNYLAILVLLFAVAIGVDWLIVRWQQPPLFGCLLRPILYLVLSKMVAIWVTSVGILMLLIAKLRATGIALLIAGFLVGLFPELLESYFQPLCAAHETLVSPDLKPPVKSATRSARR